MRVAGADCLGRPQQAGRGGRGLLHVLQRSWEWWSGARSGEGHGRPLQLVGVGRGEDSGAGRHASAYQHQLQLHRARVALQRMAPHGGQQVKAAQHQHWQRRPRRCNRRARHRAQPSAHGRGERTHCNFQQLVAVHASDRPRAAGAGSTQPRGADFDRESRRRRRRRRRRQCSCVWRCRRLVGYCGSSERAWLMPSGVRRVA